MPAPSASLYLLDDLAEATKTRKLADSDLNALHAVADWIRTFVAAPNKDLRRAGPVCPFVPGGLERKTPRLAPEQIGDKSVRDVVELMNEYRKLLLRTRPVDGDDTNYKAIVIVFTDLSADRASNYFDDAQVQHLKRRIPQCPTRTA